MSKAGLHEGTSGRVERLAGRTQHIVHDGRHIMHRGWIDRRTLKHAFALLAA
jgi:hypothetical protein